MLALARPLYLLTFSTVDADAEDDVFKLRESGLRVAPEIEHTQSPVWRLEVSCDCLGNWSSTLQSRGLDVIV